MSMLLLVRGGDDAPSAVEAANELLVYRRRHSPEPREVDEVLGIWLRRELDADLPAWPWFERELGAGIRLDPKASGVAPAPSLAEAAVGIRESFSFSGLWSLCWIDGTLLQEARTAKERRDRILDALVKDSATQPKAFLPVFDVTETRDGVDALLQELRAEHADLVSTTWFIDDREQGLVGPEGTR